MTPAYLSLRHLLSAGRAPDHALAIDQAGNPLPWQRWCEQVMALRLAIQTGPAGAWGIYCEDSAHAAAALFAVWSSGNVAWLPGNQAADTLQWLDQQVVGWISDVPLPCSKPVIAIDPLIAKDATTIGPRSAPLKEPPAPLPLADDEIALYVFTSGSSGEPKAISKTLRQLQAELDNLQDLWGASLHHTTLVASVSHQHVYGLLFRLLWPLCNGCCLVRNTIQYPEQWFAVTRRLQRVTWVASPALYKRMHALLPWPELAPHVTQLFSSGGKLPEESAAFLHAQLQRPVIEVFGSSETGGVGWRESMGRPTPWTCFRGIHVTRADNGGLMIESPYLPDASTYCMGDSVEIFDDGRFMPGERLDRIVKIEEKRVSLPQLEQQLCAHPWVEEAHVIPLAVQGRQSLGAIVVLAPALRDALLDTRKQLTDILRQTLASTQEAVALPKKWRFVTELPVNAQGKHLQQAMTALFDTPDRLLWPEVMCKIATGDNEQLLMLAVPTKLSYFHGHFEKAHILPGVVQIEWVWHLASQLWSLPDTFSDLEVMKFQRVITPLQIVQLTLRYDAQRHKIYFQFQSSKGTHSSGRIVLKHAAAHDIVRPTGV